MSELINIVDLCWHFQAICHRLLKFLEQFVHIQEIPFHPLPTGIESISEQDLGGFSLSSLSLLSFLCQPSPSPRHPRLQGTLLRCNDAFILLMTRIDFLDVDQTSPDSQDVHIMIDQATDTHLLVSAFGAMGLFPSMGTDIILSLRFDRVRPTRI
jgi:hypothetical protein